MQVELIRVTVDPKDAMAVAGSNCYDSVASERIVDHCYKSGHHSILEFADFHFKIKGVSRVLTHQLVRHRVASYAQRSQRYCSEDGFGYVTPNSIGDKRFELDLSYLGLHTKNMSFSYEDIIEIIQDFYTAMTDNGIPNEDARFILPNATESVIDVKMNFRELIHFMNERLCTCSQWEIRALANKMKQLVVDNYPELEEMLVPKCMKHAPYNFCYEGKDRCCGISPHISEVYKPQEKKQTKIIIDGKTVSGTLDEIIQKIDDKLKDIKGEK